MRGGLPPRGAAPLGRALVLAVGLALLLAACAREFATQPAVAPRLDRGAGWRDTLSVTDTAVLEFQLTAGNSDTLAPARATWASSDDRVLRVEPLAATSGDAARDTLAARRTRVRVIAGGPGAVTLTVRTEPAAGLAAAERAFPVVVRPLRYVPVRWRAALSAGESDTLQVEVRDVVRGRVLADRPLRWQSSDETRLRIVPIPAAGASADPAAERRLRVRAVALADGQVSVTVGLDPSVAAAGSDTTLAVDVAPLTIARSAGQDTLAVADTATFQVRLGTRFTDSLPGRFTWESSNDAVLRLTTPAPTNVAAADTLAARGARRVVTALAPGTATVTATSIPTGGEAAVQRSWAIRVLPLALEVVAWPDTVSVDDAPQYAVRVVDSVRRRPAANATVAWRSSADTLLALAAPSGSAGVWTTTADPRQYGNAMLTAVALGPTGAPAGALARRVRVMERYDDVVATSRGVCARNVRGLVYCWGGGATLIPTVIRASGSQLPFRATRILAGDDEVCAESAVAAGAWSCWDANEGGGAEPARLRLGGLQPLALAHSARTSCLSASGINTFTAFEDRYLPYCWGPSAVGGGRPQPSDPVFLPSPTPLCGDVVRVRCEGIVDVAVTSTHACGLHVGRGEQTVGGRVTIVAQEAVYCWGQNEGGQLGGGSAGPSGAMRPAYVAPAPVEDSRLLGPVRVVQGASCVQHGSTAFCWGGEQADTSPVPRLAGLAPRTLVAVSGTPIVCALGAGGRRVACDVAPQSFRQLPFLEFTPDRFAALADGSVKTKVAAGARINNAGWTMHGCSVDERAGAVRCWGNNRYGQHGSGALTTNVPDEDMRPGGRVREPDWRP